MQVVFSATLSSLHCVLVDFHMFTDTLMQNLELFSDFYLRSIGTKLACHIAKVPNGGYHSGLDLNAFSTLALTLTEFSLLICGPH